MSIRHKMAAAINVKEPMFKNTSSDKTLAPFKKLYGFLAKKYVKGHGDYDKDVSKFFKRYINHEEVFDVDPDDALVIYTDEWKAPDIVYKALSEAESDEENTAFIADFTDDDGFGYYAYFSKATDEDGDEDDELDDGELQIIVRSTPFDDMSKVRNEIIDSGWHVIRMIKEDGSSVYVWESYPLEIMEFMELYCALVKRYGEWVPDEDSEGSTFASDSDAASDEDDESSDGSVSEDMKK